MQRLAALAKWRSSATATKVRNWRSSIRAVYQTDSIISLDESGLASYIRPVAMEMLTARAPWYLAGPLTELLIVLLLWVSNKPLGALGGYIELHERAIRKRFA